MNIVLGAVGNRPESLSEFGDHLSFFLAFSQLFPRHHRLQFYPSYTHVLVTGGTESAVPPKKRAVSFAETRACPDLNAVVRSLG